MLLLLAFPAQGFSQVSLCKMQKFQKQIPPGNYSGITPLGDDRYAVVSDKAETDGFYVFRIRLDTVRGRITEVVNEGYRSSGEKNRDMEGIAFSPSARTLFVSGEADNEVFEYALDGRRTGRKLLLPEQVKKATHNYGLESLTYDAAAHRFYTTTEHPLPGDSLLRILAFGDDLQPAAQYFYPLDTPPAGKANIVYGVAELCALGDGSLLVLERQLCSPKKKIGTKAVVRLYRVFPVQEGQLEKHLVTEFTTRINLLRQNLANFEGMCVPAKGWLLLIADSQNRYKGVLRDWFRLVRLPGA